MDTIPQDEIQQPSPSASVIETYGPSFSFKAAYGQIYKCTYIDGVWFVDKWTIIMDGWYELSATYGMSPEVFADFVNQRMVEIL